MLFFPKFHAVLITNKDHVAKDIDCDDMRTSYERSPENATILTQVLRVTMGE